MAVRQSTDAATPTGGLSRQIVIPLDDYGQPGRTITMRNPRLATWGLLKSIRAAVQEGGEDAGFTALRSLIISWDLTDEDGTPIPQLADDPDAFDALPLAVLMRLADEVGGLLGTNRKEQS